MKKRNAQRVFSRDNLSYLVVLAGFAIMQVLSGANLLSSSVRGYLVPVCVYISLAVSLNLLVGICGELKIGRAHV